MNRKLLLSIPALLLATLSVQQAQAQPHPETPIYFNAPTIDDTAHASILPREAQALFEAPAETPIYFRAHAVQPVETVATATAKSIPNTQQNVESPGTPIYFRSNRS